MRRYQCQIRPLILALASAGFIGGIWSEHSLGRAKALDDVAPKRPDAIEAAPPQNAGRVFHLRVVTADTDRPIPKANVRLWFTTRTEWRVTDDQGRLDIEYATGPDNQDLGIDVWGDGWAMQRHQWGKIPNQPIPPGETIRLQPGETLGGIVQDEQGHPIEGAMVYLWSHNFKKKDPHELLYDLRAVTGPDGRWKTGGAPETTGELLTLGLDHPDYLNTRRVRHREPVPEMVDLRAGRAVSVMRKGVPIEGRVLSAGGQPVAGAIVSTTDDRKPFLLMISEFDVVTDADGRFRTGQVNPGRWSLLVRARGHAPAEMQVDVGTTAAQVEVQLGNAFPITGRVVTPDGKPIKGASVIIHDWHQFRGLGTLYTDAEGRFIGNDVPLDGVELVASAPGYMAETRPGVTPTGGDVIFVLSPSLSIYGRVKDARTNLPILEAVVEVGAVDPRNGDVTTWTRPEQARLWLSDGDLNVAFPVEADAYKFRIRAEGYAPFISRAFRRAERKVSDYNIELVPIGP